MNNYCAVYKVFQKIDVRIELCKNSYEGLHIDTVKSFSITISRVSVKNRMTFILIIL